MQPDDEPPDLPETPEPERKVFKPADEVFPSEFIFDGPMPISTRLATIIGYRPQKPRYETGIDKEAWPE